ncbi:conserved hypothetical protein [Solidesulfovibrio fructosivorans JJ]]|uniref:Uncharacterized protein n=1 Tax=Solidesulfovibrio fructosivorans JJ] TaxID=596151 RepID=E1JRD9_SOLFR|nr:hypothetical protein [Solidesulfovibrio fructosivorans]EFL53140.1 conserved hypothetical protein [Solidesulfovibrio fructosivorans JJ]]
MKAVAQARAERRYVRKRWRRCARCVYFRSLNGHGNNVCSLDGAPTPKTAYCKEFTPTRRPECNPVN